ncbi:MAG: glutaredoxin family protein [Thermoplasmata archaeon]|nr:glutaredoxin family protein [Thermoplasmata archaeon]
MNCTKIPGKNCEHQVMIYTLSTCGWCKKLKALLSALDVEHEYVDVDLLTGEELNSVREEVKKHNPRGSFPTLVIDQGAKVIIGFKEDEVKEALSG